MNINQQRQENRQDFQIDQNEQNINRLRKKTKELSDGFDALSQSASVSQTDIASLKTDVATAKSDIAELKSLGSTTEEKVELGSYDCYKTKDRIYRDTCWLPRPIGFVAESGKMFKFRVKFDAVSSFTTTITSTAKITFDEEEIYSDTKEIPAGGTHAVDFEYITSSERTGHKLIIELRNTETPARRTNCCIPEFLTVELWGTNVQFVSRNYDFCVIPAGNNVVMTTMAYNNKTPYFSMQAADENLSLEENAFQTARLNGYRDYNVALPFVCHTFDETQNKVVFSDKPSIIAHNMQTDETNSRIVFYNNIEASNDVVAPNGITFIESFVSKPIMCTSENISSSGIFYPDFINIHESGCMFMKHHNSANFLLHDSDDTKENFDCCGVLRLDNFDISSIFYGVTTRQNGTSFLWSLNWQEYSSHPQQLELGFGTHPNAYLMENGQIFVFLRVGKNIKKLVINIDPVTKIYSIANTEIFPDCQEYWLTPNGTHFERVGNKIKFYLANSSTPTKTLTMFC